MELDVTRENVPREESPYLWRKIAGSEREGEKKNREK